MIYLIIFGLGTIIGMTLLTAVMAYAMLSGAMVQNRTSGNATRFHAADSLADMRTDKNHGINPQ